MLAADGGTVALPGDVLDLRPFKRDAPPESHVIILGVKTPTARGYAFLPLPDLNLLHFHGAHERGELGLTVTMHPW